MINYSPLSTTCTLTVGGDSTFAGEVQANGGIKVVGPASHNTIQSANAYVLGLNDQNGTSQWWFNAYTNGNFAIHENGVGDKFTIAAGGNATFAGNITALTGSTSGNITVGRNVNEKTIINVTDQVNSITAYQDSDGNATHNFTLNRVFAGTGANDFIIQKDGTAQFTLDTSANATFTGRILSTRAPAASQAAPTLAFGDGDSGFYERFDDDIRVSIAGTGTWEFAANSFGGVNGGNSILNSETASTTNPTVIPYRNDPNTGLGGNGADILSLISGGVNGLNVISSGNVGIGTTSPYGKLNVIPSSNPTTPSAANQIVVGESSANSQYNLRIGYFLEGGAYKGSIQAISGNTPNTLILNGDGGNVGIGTTSPPQRLLVAAPSSTSVVLGASYSSTNNNNFFETGIVANDGYLILRNSGVVSTVKLNSDGNSYLNGGNVGIGTTSPTAKLDVAGTGNFTGLVSGITPVAAANFTTKDYVDSAVSGVPQGTVTISGTPVNNELAVWTSATSIEGESELTYDGNTFTVGGSGNTTTTLKVIGTNTAGSPATAAAIKIYGYEGRGEGIFYYDSAYSAAEWYSGIPYGGGNTYQIGYDATGNQAQYTANAVMTMDASKNTFFAGDLIVNGDQFRMGSVMLQDSGAGRLGFNRNTTNGVIHDSTYNAFQIQVNTTGASGMLEFQEYTGAGAFVGNTYITGNGITINDYVTHNGDTTTRFGFAAADTFQIDTDGSLRFGVNNSGMKLGGANARVTTIYDQDNMSSNSATALATQQSIKQYVDTAFSNAGTVTGTGATARVAFWNGTSSISSNSTLSWDDGNGRLGIGTSSATTSLTIAAGHGTTRANLYYNGGTNVNNAYIDMWASEPGVTYNGSGIGSNINGSPYYGRKVTEQGQTYIRFVNGQFEIYTGTNSSGTGSTAAKRFQITDGGLATFYQVPIVGTMATSDNSTRSASTAFVTTAIGNVSTGVQSVGGTANRISSSGGTTPNIDAITGTVSITSANLATGAQIQTAINEATTGALKFVSEWSASGTAGGSPDLRVAGTHEPGNYYIVSVAGSATPNGAGTTPNEWAVGDWCIRADLATDTWQKIDNTQVGNVTGSGTTQRLAFWNSDSNITSDEELTWDGVNLNIGTFAGTGDCELRLFGSTPNNSFSTLKTTNGNLHIDPDTGHGTFLNYYAGTAVYIGNGASNYSGTQFNASGDVTIGDELTVTTINNATIDTDKFAVYDSGNKLYYRTGAQVLSDIGGAPASGSGNYLPVADPAFTGTLTGPAITITGNATVAGATLSGDTYSDPDLLLSVLSVDTNTSLRNKIGSSTSMTMVSDSTAPAPGVFEVSGSYYPDPFGQYYTIDEGDTFTFEFWYKWHSGDSTYNLLYAGSSFYNAAGSSLGNVNRYWGESALNINANSGSDWYHVSGTLGPDRGTSVGDIPATAVSMRLLFLFNYAANGTSVTRFCGLKVYKSGQTVTQLYRKTLGSEATTTRNRDLVVDQNGDLYGSNLTITGNLIGNTANTTELGTYTTGAISRIRMSQGGELHFGDTTTSAPLGITEGDWNQFGDQDRLSIYGRSSIKFYAGSISSVLAATLQSTGLTLNTITNATTDTDKFLVSDSGVIKYRTGAQVLSDIGGAPATGGSYLPIANPTFTGTLSGPAATITTVTGALVGNVTGNVSGSSGSTTGNAATVTNGVYTIGTQSIAGLKSFTTTPISVTRSTADNSTYLATTAFVKNQGYTSNVGDITAVVAGNGLSGGGTSGSVTLNTVHLPSFDTRSTNPDPEDYANLIRFDFKSNGSNGLSDGGSYNGQMTWRSYGSGSDLSGGQPIRLAYTANGNLWRQMGTSATTWGSWAKFALEPSTGGFLPLAGGTMTGATKHGDDVYSYWGTGDDLRIYHNSSNGSNIWNTVGHLTIQNTADDKDIRFYCDNGAGGNAEYFRLDGAEVETVFSKTTHHLDNIQARFGIGGDLRIYHDGSNSFIQDTGTGDLYVDAAANFFVRNQANGEVWIKGTDSGVSLRYQDSQKLITTNAGVTVTGSLATTEDISVAGTLMVSGTTTAGGTLICEGDITVQDSDKILIGNDGDLELYHTSSISYIDNNTGSLYIRSNVDGDDGGNIYIQAKSGENSILCNDDGAVQLYNNNVEIARTSSSSFNSRKYFGFGENGTSVGSGYGFKYGAVSPGTSQGMCISTSASGGGVLNGAARFENLFSGSGSACAVLIVRQMNTNIYSTAIQFRNQSNLVGFVRMTSTTTAYSTSGSDLRLKKHIATWDENVLDKFKKIQPKTFRFKTQDDSEERTVGFIAQNEVDKFPEAYIKTQFKENEEPMYAFNPSGMVTHLMKAIKELTILNEDLTRRVKTLEAK